MADLDHPGLEGPPGSCGVPLVGEGGAKARVEDGLDLDQLLCEKCVASPHRLKLVSNENDEGSIGVCHAD